MGLNPLNFGGRGRTPYDNSGFENLPGKLLEAYQMPMKMKREAEDRELKNKLLEAQTKHQNLAGQSELEKNAEYTERVRKEGGEQDPRYIYAQQYLQNKAKSEKGAQATNESKKFDEWKKIQDSDMSPEDKKVARQIYKIADPLSPEAQKEIETNIPKEARGKYFGDLTDAQIQTQSKIMENDLKQAEIMQETLPEIRKGLEITKNNPDLWKSWAQHLEKMESLGEYGFSDWLLKNTTLNAKEKSDLSLLNKITNTIVRNESMIDKLKGGAGSRSSDLITRIIEKGKASSENPGDVNEYIFKALEDRYKIGKPWADAIRTGIMNNVRVISNPEAFKKMADAQQSQQGDEDKNDARREANNAQYKKYIENPNATVEFIGKNGKKYKLSGEAIERFLAMEANS